MINAEQILYLSEKKKKRKPYQKATVVRSSSSASAGAHLHAIYMVAHSDHRHADISVSIISDILWLFPLCRDSANQLRI